MWFLLIKRIKFGIKWGKGHSITMIAEGADSSYNVSGIIKEKMGIDTWISVLGHIQGGGIPTALDRIISSKMGT